MKNSVQSKIERINKHLIPINDIFEAIKKEEDPQGKAEIAFAALISEEIMGDNIRDLLKYIPHHNYGEVVSSGVNTRTIYESFNEVQKSKHISSWERLDFCKKISALENAPSDVLEELALMKDSQVRKNIANNPASSSFALETIARRKHISLLEKLIKITGKKRNFVSDIAEEENEDNIVVDALKNKNAGYSLIFAFRDSKIKRVREVTAIKLYEEKYGKGTASMFLKEDLLPYTKQIELAKHPDPLVRRMLANGKEIFPDTFKELSLRVETKEEAMDIVSNFVPLKNIGSILEDSCIVMETLENKMGSRKAYAFVSSVVRERSKNERDDEKIIRMQDESKRQKKESIPSLLNEEEVTGPNQKPR